MTLIIETGVGVRNANAYVNVAYVTNYLTVRNRVNENSWSTAGTAVQEAAIVGATDYSEKRFSHRYGGVPKVIFEEEFATGAITFTGLPVSGETLTLGDETYTFVSALTGEKFEVLIGGTTTTVAEALEAAINGTAGAGVTYGLGTPQSRHSTATSAGGVVSLTASAPGTSGALTVLTGSPTNVTLTAFTGGRDGGLQPLSFPRDYLYDARGQAIVGVPERLKQAISEYAVRAVSSVLLPDPTSDTYGGRVNRRKEKVGPIEEEYQYDAGTVGSVIFTAYPAADKLIRPLLLGSSGGGVIRA